MHSWLVILLILNASGALAENTSEFDVHAKLFVDGRLVSSPRVLALPGESAELSQMSDSLPDKLDVKIIANDDADKSEDGIFIRFDVYYRKGHKVVEATPAILLKPGEPTTVVIGQKEGADVKLQVSAVRLTE